MKEFIRNGLVLIGAGNMGGALLSGWLDKGLEADKITVFDPEPNGLGSSLIREHQLLHNPPLTMVENTDVVVIAVKPQIIDAVLDRYQSLFTAQAALITIVAGIPLARYREKLGAQLPIVRCMPNTPVIVKRGMTIGYVEPEQPDMLKALFEVLFQTVGDTAWIKDEKQFDAITAVSGSGPAYVFLLAECLAAAACHAGLDTGLAEAVVRKTIDGAGVLLCRSMKEAAQLRQEVASPGGVTEAALEILMRDDRLANLFNDAITAATLRSHNLGTR